MRNIEIKARLGDPEAARKIAASLAQRRLGVQEQVDTYFHCPHGRLKLRQIDRFSAQLVWYARPDDPQPKASDYRLVPVPNPETLKAALSLALGVRGVVRKRREVFLIQNVRMHLDDVDLIQNVRIHLDDVEGLGHFLEFEAVLEPGMDDAAGRAQLDRLLVEFGIRSDELLAGSYSEMLFG